MSVSPRSLDHFPGPRSPALFQVLDWMRHQHTFFNRHADRYGPAYRIRFPFLYEGKVAVFATPSAAEQVLRLPPSVAHAGEAYKILRQSTGPSSVIVLDEEMPWMSGSDAAVEIRKISPHSRIVSFSGAMDTKPAWADGHFVKGSVGDLSLVIRLPEGP